jgi:hypothetical protein
MSIKAFKKIDSPDRIVNTLQENVDSVFKQILTQPILNGNIVKNITLTTGVNNIINTGISGKINGWLIIRNRANSVIWDAQDSNPDPMRTLVLLCSANTVVDVLIF